CHHYYGAPHSF
nr:immunoglobulin light chain junction region [Macaca mulatta]